MAVAGQRMLGRWGSSGTVDVGSMFKDMEVSINGWYPKMMVYNGKSQSKMDDLGVPPFMETTICLSIYLFVHFLRAKVLLKNMHRFFLISGG
jgi:hypothetical protein